MRAAEPGSCVLTLANLNSSLAKRRRLKAEKEQGVGGGKGEGSGEECPEGSGEECPENKVKMLGGSSVSTDSGKCSE